RAGIFPPPTGLDAAGRGLSSRRRHAGAHHGGDRGADRHPHRLHRRAVFPVASRDRSARLAMTLSTDNLGFGYHGKPVGHGVTIEIQSGEVLCLLGPNGGGKTTLMKTL